MKKIKRKKRIGLALGGGAVLGAAHIGVLKALEEFNISISCIAGTSIGAFISTLAAFNKSWKEINKIALDLNWFDISQISLSQKGLLSNKKFKNILLNTIGDKDFKQSHIPLSMIATDISSGEKVILKEGKISSAVMASTCLPGIFTPVEINNRSLVDGGIVENVPVTPLKEMHADYIIAVDLINRYSSKKPENIVNILLNSFYFTIITATELQTKEADLIIEPDLTRFNMVDTHQVTDLIEAGYSEAVRMLQKVV
ncbi:MAG: patatin-like phospholipase family protein [Spirochaetes bacterium]|nr:patatin-like phospholipase family protein [Spirochaetota bacterium]